MGLTLFAANEREQAEIDSPVMNTTKLVSFDWALKRLLRSKANYEVLEGFLSELLKGDIEILEILGKRE